MFPSLAAPRLGATPLQSPRSDADDTRLPGPVYAAIRATFGPVLVVGGVVDPERIMGTEGGRGRLGAVLGALGLPATGTDRASLERGVADLQRAAGLPVTGQLDVGTLAVMSLALQGAEAAAVPAAPRGAAPEAPPPRAAAPEAPPPRPATPSGGTNTAGVIPQRQRSTKGCGQTSVAMALSATTGRKVTEQQVAARYGYSLLRALNAESGGAWKDYGNLQVSNVGRFGELLDQKVNQEKTPVIIGLGGTFTSSGYGHIVTIVGYDRASGKVSYADPADGKIKQTTLQYMASQPPHHDGRFVFATR